MSNELQPGVVINTSLGMPAKVKRYLAGGGQGDVYVVEVNGIDRAMKWYKPQSVNNPKAFFDNLRKNASKGAPDQSFLWPLAVTEPSHGSFGYIMELRGDRFHELSEFMVGSVGFDTFKAAVEACIRIAAAFRIIHNNGYCYQDLSDGNFFIDPKTGDVLICDNDNVAPNGTDTFILGTPRYMAPEIVCGKAEPSIQTDRFSLAIVLFMILCMNHPLEGKHWLVPCLTPSHERKLYGEEALFIYDKQDASNRPVRGVHSNVIKRWQHLPSYLQEAFYASFSQESIRNPGKRLRETDWLKVLVRFQSDIVLCPNCGNEVFIKNCEDTLCDRCKKKYQVRHTIELPDYSVTAERGARVYRCQLSTCNAREVLQPVGFVVAKGNDDSQLGFRNMSKDTLLATTPSGKNRPVKPGEVVPLKSGITIEAFIGTIKIV